MKKALGSLTALLLLIVMLPAAAEATEGRIKYWYASRYTDEGYVWVEQSETWTDTSVIDNGETGRILDTPPDGAELWITNPPVPLTVEGNFSDVYLIGGTVTFLGDIEWLTLFEADWESPDITVYGDIEKITMSPLQQGEMSLRTTGDIGVVYLKYGEEGPFKSFSWYGDGVTMATLMDKGSILPPLSDGVDPEPPKGGAKVKRIGLVPPVAGDAPAISQGDAVTISQQAAELSDEELSALKQAGFDQGCAVAAAFSLSMTREDGTAVTTLDEPVTLRVAVPPKERKRDTSLVLVQFCRSEDGTLTAAALAQADGTANLIAFDADQPAIIALVRTGVPDHSRLLYIGGGAVAVLILGGIIAVSVVKKREKAAAEKAEDHV